MTFSFLQELDGIRWLDDVISCPTALLNNPDVATDFCQFDMHQIRSAWLRPIVPPECTVVSAPETDGAAPVFECTQIIDGVTCGKNAEL